jgi:hypothetical protein
MAMTPFDSECVGELPWVNAFRTMAKTKGVPDSQARAAAEMGEFQGFMVPACGLGFSGFLQFWHPVP